uniref:Sugar phosphate transporter domain-containing protein n=1 Tax=Alexandrium catenella TaxID=2925 RepID=A0A7S1S3Q2_ALECA|mmetsp:Transcript_82567/g.219151  ORF Transcript_82567/g.219151 Transcript_82567/m.219151 type:complete len:347 (+) Transcript_82567:90-1130(+)
MQQYSGAEFKGLQAASSAPPAAAKAGLFLLFATTRAVHTTVIAASKVADPVTGHKSYAYSTISVVLGEAVVTLVIAQLMVLANGGMAEWRLIWNPSPLKVFSLIGSGFALGDYLELASIGALGGGLLISKLVVTSKLVITALLMWAIKGTRQTALQWILLCLVVLSMGVYMLGNQCIGIGGGGVSVIGVLMVLMKVASSCLSAVLSDKYMKEYKSEPIYMQLVQIKCGWFLTLFILSFVDGETWQKGFFSGWNGVTVGVLASFAMKSFCTVYLLAILDSVLKNIGEATAVLLIYAAQVLLPCYDCRFEVPAFLSVMVVVLSVTAYVGSKSVVAKAEKYDKCMSAKG